MDPQSESSPSVNRRRGLAWAMGGALGGGFFAIPWKVAAGIGESAHNALILLVVAAIANTVLLVGQRVTARAVPLSISGIDFWVASALALFTLFGNLASAAAIEELSPALLNVMLRSEVILVAVLAWILLGERVELRFWFGAALAVVGLTWMQGAPDGLASFGRFGPGTGMALLGACCFSSMAIVTRRFIHRIQPVMVNALRLWIAVAMWFVFNASAGLADVPREQIFFAGLAALAGPFFGRLCIMISSRDLEARVTALSSLATPAMTLGLAFLFLGDWPMPHELIGGAVMIGGISLSLIRSVRWPRRVLSNAD